MSKICILCAYRPDFAEVAEITIHRNKGTYAVRWNYDLEIKTNIDPMYFDPESHVWGISWDRLAYMLSRLKSGEYDWIWCVGGDTMITNFTIPLESFTESTNRHVIATGDACCTIQADSFLVRSSPEGIAFVSEVMDQWPRLKHHTWVENQAMIELLPKHENNIQILPQRALNAYDYRLYADKFWACENHKRGLDIYGNDGQWKPGDFLIHWPATGTRERFKMAKEITPHIVQ